MKLLAVNYHYFREKKYDSGIYPLNRVDLNNQIDELSKYYQFISQYDLIKWIKTEDYPNGNYCILTMDDGLKEQIGPFEWLYAKGIPTVLYVPVQPIKEHTVLPVHQLHFLRSRISDDDLFDALDASYHISKLGFNEGELMQQYRYDHLKAKKVKYFLNFMLGEEEKNVVIRGLFSTLIGDETSFARQLYLDESELKAIADLGCLGSHGFAHVPLTRLEWEKARQDVHASLNWLETLTGQAISSFSYPYGSHAAVNESLGALFENTSVHFAFTMWRGWNSPEHLNNPFFLNRVDTNDAPGGKSQSSQYVPMLKNYGT